MEILGDEQKFVSGMKCVQMELGAPDESGRRRPVVKEGSEFVLDVDCVIMAIGTSPNPLIKATTSEMCIRDSHKPSLKNCDTYFSTICQGGTRARAFLDVYKRQALRRFIAITTATRTIR